MSLRTYPLIANPAFVEFVGEAINGGVPLEKVRSVDRTRVLPRIDHFTDISAYLGVSPETIWSMITSPRRHYRTFPITKRSGETRYISAPRTHLKVVQWWILDTILSELGHGECVYGFVRGRSFLDNAKRHIGQTHVLNVDVRNFFPSIKVSSVSRVFSNLGYSDAVSRFLAALCCFDGELPQGAPTSPAISNAVFNHYDSLINECIAGQDIIYTRYADDLTFSSRKRIPAQLVDEVRNILKPQFYLNEKKTRYMGPNQKKEVTGLVLGLSTVALDREFLNTLRSWFNAAGKYPEKYVHSLEKIEGNVAFVKMVQGRGSAKVIELGEQAIRSINDRFTIRVGANTVEDDPA